MVLQYQLPSILNQEAIQDNPQQLLAPVQKLDLQIYPVLQKQFQQHLNNQTWLDYDRYIPKGQDFLD